MLEIQKLAYFLEREIISRDLPNPLQLEFRADRFGPFSPKLRHLLNALDGSYLHCDKRLADAGLLDVIGYDDRKIDRVALYLNSEAKTYCPALAGCGKSGILGPDMGYTARWVTRCGGDVRCAVGISGARRCSAMWAAKRGCHWIIPCGRSRRLWTRRWVH